MQIKAFAGIKFPYLLTFEKKLCLIKHQGVENIR